MKKLGRPPRELVCTGNCDTCIFDECLKEPGVIEAILKKRVYARERYRRKKEARLHEEQISTDNKAVI